MASNRLRALTRVRKFLSQEQTKRLSEAYIIKTFNTALLYRVFVVKLRTNPLTKSTNSLSD